MPTKQNKLLCRSGKNIIAIIVKRFILYAFSTVLSLFGTEFFV